MEKIQSIPKTQTWKLGQDFENVKNFPILPNQIHKVPEEVRKALKAGKYRKNISINAINMTKRGNSYNVENKISKNVEDMKQYSCINFRQVANIKQKQVQDEDGALSKRQQADFLRLETVVTNRYSKNQIFKPKKGYNVTLYERRKLSPIKKKLLIEPKLITTRQARCFKSTFLNIQKAPLVKYSERTYEDKEINQMRQRKYCSLAFSHYGKNSFIETQLQSTAASNKTDLFRKSQCNMSPIKIGKIKLKPFAPPFQRYHYRDFIWKCAYSFGVFHQSPQSYAKKFKVFIGRGNNSMLVKGLMKRRSNWWVFTDRYDEANLIWTQIKINVVFHGQKNQQSRYQKFQPFCPMLDNLSAAPMKQSSKLNLKILKEHQLFHWKEYFSKFRRIEDNLDETLVKRNKIFSNQNHKLTCKSLTKLDLKTIKIHNHLPNNYIISNKKALFYTMSTFYEKINEDVFEFLPLTFHIQNGLEDPQYLKFLNSYYERAKRIRSREKGQQDSTIPVQQKQQLAQPQSPSSPSRISAQNIWIVKPGEFTNRGNGITVCMNLQEIKAILKKKQRHDDGHLKTYIIQSYIEKPFLYQRRKFDIRHYMMIVSINGIIKGYWYQQGYIRTTSYEYSTKNGFSSVHLTNDAVQKYLPEYGKYEKGNKISYEEFQKYLEREYGKRYNFYKDVYPKMKKIATDSIKACSFMIDPQKKGHNFEIFGMDFMIDADFHPWLIQINNNPCLEISCPLLGEIIPPMVQNALKICVDSIIPPPSIFQQKKPRFSSNMLQQNKFELVYNSAIQQQQIISLFNGKRQLDLDYKQLEKEEDEVFDDDGVEMDY